MINSDPQLSVIIPVYNVEEYLQDSLESVIQQINDNIEVICINDGSTDCSSTILRKFAKKYPIKIINQVNKGLSSARNCGLREAKGEYIYFFDSDDILVPGLFDSALSLAMENNLDMVIFNHIKYYEDCHKFGKQSDFYDFSDCFIGHRNDFFKTKKELPLTVWSYFIKRKLLLDNEISFVEGIVYEDELFTPQIVRKMNTFGYLSNVLYIYRQRKRSLTGSTKKDMQLHSIDLIINHLVDLYNDSKDDKIYRSYIKDRINSRFYFYFILTHSLKRLLKKAKDFHWNISTVTLLKCIYRRLTNYFDY